MTSSDQTIQDICVALIRQMNHEALVIDGDGICVGCSESLQKLADAHQTELVGLALASLLSFEAAKDVETFLGKCRAAEDASQVDTVSFVIELGGSHIRMSLEPFIFEERIVACLAQPTIQSTDDLPKLNYLLENLDQGVWDYNIAEEVFRVSPAWYRLRGLDQSYDINARRGDWLLDIHPDDRQKLHDQLYRQTQSAFGNLQIAYRHIHTAGHWVWIMCQAKVVETDEDGLPTRIIGTDTDVTHLRETEEKLGQLSEKLRLAVGAAGIGVWDFNPEQNTVHWDDRMLEIFGLQDGVHLRNANVWAEFLHPDDIEDTMAYAALCQEKGAEFERDYRILRKTGEIRRIRSRATRVFAQNGVTHLVGVCIDITEDYERAQALEQAKARLQHDSRHDALTGLANRRRLDETIAAYNDSVACDRTYAVLHLDLDHFKPVNDTLGHAAGDAILVVIAKRLQQIVDAKGLACRIGGDEFAVFLPIAPETEALKAFCGKIIMEFNKSIPYETHKLRIGVSIGCALGRGKFDKKSDVFIAADKALYAAKSAGRNCYHFAHFEA